MFKLNLPSSVKTFHLFTKRKKNPPPSLLSISTLKFWDYYCSGERLYFFYASKTCKSLCLCLPLSFQSTRLIKYITENQSWGVLWLHSKIVMIGARKEKKRCPKHSQVWTILFNNIFRILPCEHICSYLLPCAKSGVRFHLKKTHQKTQDSTLPLVWPNSNFLKRGLTHTRGKSRRLGFNVFI